MRDATQLELLGVRLGSCWNQPSMSFVSGTKTDLLPSTVEGLLAESSTRAHNMTRVVRYSRMLVAVIEGQHDGLRVEAAGSVVRVGSAPDNTMVLCGDDAVSRHHCEIVPIPEGVTVRDAGSKNGSYVGSIRISNATFRDSFLLRVGASVLSVALLAEAVEREQSLLDRFGDLLGRSDRMRELFADLARISASNVSVLIEGETGTGKELVAESIHAASARATGPYVVFDCSAVAPTLAESELFGHERGAFTGAGSSRIGVFEQADGGTIFLDELGELPRELQPKLLRVLEKGEVRRVGSNRTISVDVRVVAATNRNLASEVERGNFREDVFFRVAATHVYVPPLRDRMEDLPLLVEHFLRRASGSYVVTDIPDHVWRMLRSYPWPGNVRELQNAVQRLLVTPDRALGTARRRAELPVARAAGTPTKALGPLRIARREAADEFERAYLRDLLARSEGNVTRGAAIAEVSRQMIQKLMRKHDL
jgi:transcriptional regulator with GAF, ATPase, and Fis domain